MKSKPLHILITDDKDHRRKDFSDLFRQYGFVYRYNFESDKIESDLQKRGRWKPLVDLPHFHLHLLHAGNRKQKDVVKADWRIWYGGYGQDDTRVWENEPIIKKRMDEHQRLSNTEAQELVDFVWDDGPAPSFLKIKTDKDTLLEQRADFFELLSIPADFDWEAKIPAHLFSGVESAWEDFKSAALDLLKKSPRLKSSDEAYRQYSEILTILHKRTIEDLF